MAYWDYHSGTTNYWSAYPTTAGYRSTGNYGYTASSTNSTFSTGLYGFDTVLRYVYTVTSYIVSGFDGWEESLRADFTRLINDETKTGFTVQCWIEGDVKITDPNVREVDVEQFRQLLMMHARGDDRQRIIDFFNNRVGNAPDQAL